MKEFRILTRQECNENMLEIFKKIGKSAAVTDYSILQGASVEPCNVPSKMNNRKGSYWVENKEYGCSTRSINESGMMDWEMTYARYIGGRPVVDYSKIKNECKNVKTINDGVLQVEYGEYPQTVVNEENSKKLENLYLRNCLMKSGKTYTMDKSTEETERFKEEKIDEYIYSGKKYVRILGNSKSKDEYLSNNVEIEYESPYWVEVEPIKWVIDKKTNLAISEKILFAGMQYLYLYDEYDDDYYEDLSTSYEYSDYKKYIDNYFSKEIEASVSKSFSTEEQEKLLEAREKIEKRNNPYNFETKEVTEEEIIKGAIESDLAVFLHGPSSEGKSARVKEIDPDLTIIYLRNATPESLNGKSVYNAETNEMIDIKPTWLTKLEERCEKEKEKNHIVFFDEITNALPSIQGMAFNIILDKEVNGKWKLPENARIVAAGNEMSDSLSANQLSEPLFNRFVHVYIKTTVEKWLKWASEKNIHPAIYAYIASTNGKSLRTEFNGEKPNADPRKWEMASKMLYQTNNPEMLRGLVGEEVTKEFINFCKQPVITVKDVLEKNYTKEEIEALNTSERFATAYGLSQVKEENLEEVRKFMTTLGPEETKLFDTLWVHNDETRLERLLEAKLANELEEQEETKEEEKEKPKVKVKVRVKEKTQ